MKKLYLSVLAVLLPALLYMVFFFVNDPYDYFGLSRSSKVASGPRGKMLEYRNGDFEGIIIGDSRIDGYDVSELSRKTGMNCINIAFGGCMGEENAALLEWCLENNKGNLKHVIIVTDFYNMNTLLQQDRIASTEKVIETPFSYAFCYENLLDVLNELKEKRHGTKAAVDDAKLGVQKEISQSTIDDKKAENFRAHGENLAYYLNGFKYDYNVIERFCNVCDRCRDQGIEVTFIVPPVYEGFFGLLKESHVTANTDEFKKILSDHAVIYDFEYPDNELGKNYEDFRDYKHFGGETYEKFLKCIEEGETRYCRVWGE